jgi:hypothetical protein
MSASSPTPDVWSRSSEPTLRAKTRHGDYLLLANKDQATKTEEATEQNTASLLRGGELLRQAIQHAEYGFNAVAGEKRQRRCPE